MLSVLTSLGGKVEGRGGGEGENPLIIKNVYIFQIAYPIAPQSLL